MSSASKTLECCCTSLSRSQVRRSPSLSLPRSGAQQHFSTSSRAQQESTSQRDVTPSSSSTSEGRGYSRSPASSQSSRNEKRQRSMLPIQPRPMNWNHALSTSLYRAPVLAGTPRVPIDILVPFDPTTDPSTKPDSAADSSHPGPLIVGAKHTLKHAVRSIQFNMGGTDPKYADTPSVGYQAHKTKLTNYKGFTREADIHANSASWFEASDKLKAHQNGEARAGDYKDYVAKGPLLGRLLRGTESESGSPQERLKRASNSKQDEDQEAVNSAHPALEIADQALSQNAELGQVARQFVLHAIRDRVEPPAAPAPASDTKSAAPAASKGNAKGSPEKK